MADQNCALVAVNARFVREQGYPELASTTAASIAPTRAPLLRECANAVTRIAAELREVADSRPPFPDSTGLRTEFVGGRNSGRRAHLVNGCFTATSHTRRNVEEHGLAYFAKGIRTWCSSDLPSSEDPT